MSRFTSTFATLTAAAALLAAEAQACTRVVYHGPNATYLTARSMDFKDPIVSNLWVFPRGMKRHGAAGRRSVEWTSAYSRKWRRLRREAQEPRPGTEGIAEAVRLTRPA